MDKSQAGIKIARRNINNFRRANDTTPMAENDKELKTFLTRVKEDSDKAGLKLNFQKLRSQHPGPSFHGKYKGEKWKQ